ncbi:MAG: DUF4402 domain-containing protein [Sphingosinicella sp.]|nr:DUF4402 domain-containing protein [Sphingosinicella sp.]
MRVPFEAEHLKLMLTPNMSRRSGASRPAPLVLGKMRGAARLILASFLCLWAIPVAAQSISITAIDTASGSPNLGTLVASLQGQGDTLFTVSTAGLVTKTSGSGSQKVVGSSNRPLITVTCTGGGSSACTTTSATITITSTGTPTNRAGTLTNFTVAGGPSPPTLGARSGTSTVTFTVTGIARNTTRNFYVGMAFPIKDNGNSGVSNSSFVVSTTTTATSTASSRSGTATATVWRAVSIAKDLNKNLNFGGIIRPLTGSGSVAIAATLAGARTVTGGVAKNGADTGTGSAQFTVTGEAGTNVSISVPATITLTGPGPNLTVTTSNTGGGVQAIAGTVGAGGTVPVYVGGTLPITSTTTPGAYTGTFAVTVQYN